MKGTRGLAAAPLCSKGKGSAAFCDRLLQLLPVLAICRWRGNRREEGRKKKNVNKKPHYCRPDGNIPHDQTNQSPRWGAGAAQPWSNTPFHSLSGTNTWSPINGTPRTWGGSPEPYWSMPDDFIITHHFIHWRIRTRILITFPESRHAVHINSAECCAAACLPAACTGRAATCSSCCRAAARATPCLVPNNRPGTLLPATKQLLGKGKGQSGGKPSEERTAAFGSMSD